MADIDIKLAVEGATKAAADMNRVGKAADLMEKELMQASRGMSDLDKSTKQTGASFGAMAKGMSANVLAIGGSMAVAGIGLLGREAFNAAKDYETLSVQMGVLLGSASKVPAVLAEWKKFSDATPMEPEQINKGGKQLLAFGVAVDDVIPKMRVLGDISSGSGKDFNELIAIFGKAKAAGKVQGEILQQLVEGGINILPEFAKIMGVTQGEVAKLGSEGKLSFEIFDQALRNMTASGSLYGGMMDKLSQSTEGLLSTLKGEFQGILREIGTAFLPVIKELATIAVPALQSALAYLRPYLDQLPVVLGEVMEQGKALFEVLGRILKPLFSIKDSLEPITKGMDGLSIATGDQSKMWDRLLWALDLVADALEWIDGAITTVTDAWARFSENYPNVVKGINAITTAIGYMTNPLSAVKDLWNAVFGGAEEAVGGLAETSKRMIAIASQTLQKEFSATADQVKGFALQFDKAKVAGLSYADAATVIREEFAKYLATTKEATTATDQFAASVVGAAGKIAPAKGSIAALEAELSKLKTAFETTASGTERKGIAAAIANVEERIEFLSGQGGLLDQMKGKVTATLYGEGGASTDNVRPFDNYAQAASDAFMQVENEATTLAGKLNYALGDQAFGELKKGLEGLKSSFVSFGAGAAEAIGYAIGSGASAIDAFKKAVLGLLVEVPKLAGMALLNAAATTPSPASLPMAIAGLALIGLSGIIKGFSERPNLAAEATTTSASAMTATDTAQAGIAGLSIENSMVGATIMINVDGAEFGGAITNVLNEKDRLKGR